MRIAEAEARIAEALVGKGAPVDRVRTKEGAEGVLVVTLGGVEVELEIREDLAPADPLDRGEQAAADGELFPLQMNISEVL